MASRPGFNLYQRIDAVARQRGDAPAWLLPDGRHWTFRAVRRESGRYAAALRNYGVQPGDRVMVQVEKSPEALVLYLAIMRIGAVIVPLNTAYTPAEVEYFARDAEPHLLVVDPLRAAALREVAQRLRVPEFATLDARGDGDMPQRARALASMHGSAAGARGAAVHAVARDDLAAIVYTSGTTGRAKGAMLSHGNLVANADALAAIWQFTAADTLLHALPIYHVHGLFVATHCALFSGASMHLLPGFDAAQLLQLLPASTVFMGVPTHYTRLLALQEFDATRAAGIRLFISGSAPLLPATFAEFERRTGQRILERYGMSEAGIIASNPCDGERVAGTVGFALPDVTVRITGAEGIGLPAGTSGAVEIRGPNVFRGYWRMPERTAADFRPDGFFVTGDVGTLDDQGRLTLVGRARDLIISGGFNVYPKEIELELDALRGVIESAVIGVPHPDFGEGVIAVLAVRPGHSQTELQVIGALQDRLARFKQPKRVFFVDDLPRNTMGKVQKNRLRERYRDTFVA